MNFNQISLMTNLSLDFIELLHCKGLLKTFLKNWYAKQNEMREHQQKPHIIDLDIYYD